MARDVEQLFHETWLGEAQPLEGLTFTVPVLCDGGVMMRLSVAQAEGFNEHAPADAEGEHRVGDLRELLTGFLDWDEAELVAGDALPEDLVLRIAEEGTELSPDFAVAYPHELAPGDDDDATTSGEQTPASRAGRGFQLLGWQVPAGLSLDAAESETNEWHYPPAAKLERLLRETRVPIGLLCNGETIRLLYCPTGHATGWISFPVGFMATPAGRDMLSAFRELLHADRMLGGSAETPTTLQLLRDSRERQADVTTKLGGQLLDALQILLQGFEAAAHRDGDEVLRDAMRQEGNHLYEGLLTVMLRLVFALAAEDRGLVPAEHPVYAAHLSVGGLYDELAADEALYADTMEQRFGAWARLVMLFRALYFGVELPAQPGDEGRAGVAGLSMPPHRGRLFNPENYAFLEGGVQEGGVAVSSDARAATRLPSVSDGVVLRVLRRLLYLDGQRLSYSALEEEQLGSVYEGLMGYAVEQRTESSVCLRGSRVWVSPYELLEQAKATRVRWLKDVGVPDSAAKRIGKAVEAAVKEAGKDGQAQHDAVLEVLRGESIAKKGRAAARAGADREEAEVAAGRLVIQPGEERRRTSTHYTPRSLSGPIVAKTLEPLLAAMRAKTAEEDPGNEDPQPSSEALLSLKICDPAMGSGAFLVEACRFLAKQVHAAWVREGKLAGMIREADGDDVIQRDPERLAQRMVAQRCLYGVDKNPLAVELGKLSLWLLTLSQGQTFAFLDHCLKAGDSLVGLDRDQILAMDWDAGGDEAEKSGGKKKKKGRGKGRADDVTLDLFAEQARRAFDKAMLARRKLGDLARAGDRGATEAEQHELHVAAEAELERLRDVADVVVSAFFWPFDEAGKLTPEFLFEGKKPSDKDRRRCLERVRGELEVWLADAERGRMPVGLERRRALVRECVRPMHWHLEFPEVFDDGREDPLASGGVGKVWMDAVVGNPPFLGGKRISTANGDSYAAWLGRAFHGSSNADLSAFFFRRSLWMLGEHGTQGLIATNTIGQGDTRETGLKAMLAAGAAIYEATRTMDWPVKGANVSVSIVHVGVGTVVSEKLGRVLDGRRVDEVNSRLRPKPERADPVPLLSNRETSFIGSYVHGKGFVLTPDERERLLGADPKNAERIFPYLGGEELNSSPTQSHSRFVIDFGDMTLAQAERWPALVEILRERVKPDRDRQKRGHIRERWWQYADRRPGLHRAIAGLSRCLAAAVVTKHLSFAFQPVGRVFSHKLVVFPLPEYADFGFLQSRVHGSWAWLLSSTMRDAGINYAPSDCFETYPRVEGSATLVARIATDVYRRRAEFMVATDQGLTKTYNALKDPDDTRPEILHLRRLHEDLDRAVLEAYGESHIKVPAYCGASESDLERFEDEVLDFLFALNEQRAKEEASASARTKG